MLLVFPAFGRRSFDTALMRRLLGNLRNRVFPLIRLFLEVNPYFTPRLDGTSSTGIEVEIRTDAEADELRSYIGNKKNQRWTWYAIERHTGVILAWRNGRRTDKNCSLLTEKLSVFPVTRCYTDD